MSDYNVVIQPFQGVISWCGRSAFYRANISPARPFPHVSVDSPRWHSAKPETVHSFRLYDEEQGFRIHVSDVLEVIEAQKLILADVKAQRVALRLMREGVAV